MPQQSKDHTHGVTLEQMLNELVEFYGFPALATKIKINCFTNDPSVKSSLKFLRKTPWAREKVERLFLFYRVKKQPKLKT